MITLQELMGIQKIKTDKVNTMQDIETALLIWLQELISQQFKYDGLPKEIPFYAIESSLFNRGGCVFFKVGENHFALPSAMSGELNIYGQPTKVFAIGFNGMSYPTPLVVEDVYDNEFNLVQKREAVIIRNNQQMLSTYALILPYVSRLMYIWQSLGIHEGMSRLKMLVFANKDVSKALKKQLDSMFNSSSPVAIVYDKKSSLEKPETIDFNVDYNAQPYWDDFDNTLNLLLTVCGINNIDQNNKRERLLVDEVNANNELIDTSIQTRLRFRQDAVKKINELFGLNISVELVEPRCQGQDVEQTEEIEKDGD